MSLFVVDVEADGPCPGLYSMISFGAVRVDAGLKTTFYGTVRPISEKFDPESLAVSKISRDQHLTFLDPAAEMQRFAHWIRAHSTGKRAIFVSDNPAFDWSFVNYYFHAFTGSNPFGHSARRIGDFYAGLVRNWSVSSHRWRKYGTTKHTHHPVMDAMRCAEALLAVAKEYNIDLGDLSDSPNIGATIL
jgi:DNA polymerase III epsilon subunit-like protein